MKSKLKPMSISNGQMDFEIFKTNASLKGYNFYIHCFPVEESETPAGWVCQGKEDLAELCIRLSESFVIYVEFLDNANQFRLN
jgi:hypothetical protein